MNMERNSDTRKGIFAFTQNLVSSLVLVVQAPLEVQ